MERHRAPEVRHPWVTAAVEKVPQDALAPPGSSAVDRQLAYIQGKNLSDSTLALPTRGESHSQLVGRTFPRGGVDIQPRFLHQEHADLQVSLHRGEVERVPPPGVLGFPQVHLARQL